MIIARMTGFAAALAALSLAHPVQAQAARSMPQASPLPPALPEARDVPYPGTIDLSIDATDVVRGVFRVTQTIPVAPQARELVLLLPSWLPGNHAPRGAINLLADVRFDVDGKPVPWVRDKVAVNAFRLALPEGARQVTARFVHTSPLERGEGRIVMTREMLNLQWEKMSLYPAGYYVRGITMKPTVKVPGGWTVFTALDGMARRADSGGDTVTWAATDYERLVDSPIFAGIHAKKWDLGQNVSMDVVADSPALLEIAPANLQTYRKMVSEASALFGARHFDHYDFLLALTDRMGGIGLEHHRSSENQMDPRTWIDWEKSAWDRNVIPHEYVHSWNGKYRRPAELWTPDYQQPMRNSLLWLYEGQTQFWGQVLSARSGIQDKDTILGMFASVAGNYAEGTPGRGWRSVEDTTHDPIFSARRSIPYRSLSRGEDYYSEGALVWLEADQIIRQGTRGTKGLDDFARAFFGMRDGDWGELPYEFEDVVAALNGVHAYDWATFLKARLYQPGQPAPLRGLQIAGYALVWKDRPNAYDLGRAIAGKYLDLPFSLGVRLARDGMVQDTVWDSPAFDAGLVNGAKILAVNGTVYSDEVLSEAITSAKSTKAPIQLVVQRGDRVMNVSIAYHGGLRWPWLEKQSGVKDAPLDRLLAPRTQ